MPIYHKTACGFASVLVLSALVTAADQPAKSPLAIVTVSGKEVGISSDANKGKRLIILELDDKTKIKVDSNQNVASLLDDFLKEHRQLSKDFTEQAKTLIGANDFDKLKDVEKTFKEASAEMLKHLGHYTVHGTVVQVDDELVIKGDLRLFAYNGVDKALGKGKAALEGLAVQVPAKDGKTKLAIQNGDHWIFLTGKAADDNAKVKGTITAYGIIKAGPKGDPVMAVERIDVVQK